MATIEGGKGNSSSQVVKKGKNAHASSGAGKFRKGKNSGSSSTSLASLDSEKNANAAKGKVVKRPAAQPQSATAVSSTGSSSTKPAVDEKAVGTVVKRKISKELIAEATAYSDTAPLPAAGVIGIFDDPSLSTEEQMKRLLQEQQERRRNEEGGGGRLGGSGFNAVKELSPSSKLNMMNKKN